MSNDWHVRYLNRKGVLTFFFSMDHQSIILSIQTWLSGKLKITFYKISYLCVLVSVLQRSNWGAIFHCLHGACSQTHSQPTAFWDKQEQVAGEWLMCESWSIPLNIKQFICPYLTFQWILGKSSWWEQNILLLASSPLADTADSQ